MDAEGIEKVLRNLGVDKVKVHARTGRIQTNCPMAKWKHEHGTDDNPSMSVKIADDDVTVLKCFGCGFKGSLFWLVHTTAKLSQDPRHALLAQLVADLEKQDVEREVAKAKLLYGPELKDKPDKPDLMVWDEKELEPYLGRTARYVLNRGISIETCREWQIGWDDYRKRVVFPVRNAKGGLIGMQGRTILESTDDNPPWFNYWYFPKTNYLYGEHKIDPNVRKLMVVEGCFDALKMWEYGIRNVVATMGSYPSSIQVKKMRDYAMDVYLALDGDKAGREGAVFFKEWLAGRVRLFHMKLPQGKDPDELPKEEILGLMEIAEMVS